MSPNLTYAKHSSAAASVQSPDRFTYRTMLVDTRSMVPSKPPTNISNANATGSCKDGDQATPTSQPPFTAKHKLSNIQSSQTLTDPAAEPDSKRAKPTVLQFKKHPEFWHLDGNTSMGLVLNCIDRGFRNIPPFLQISLTGQDVWLAIKSSSLWKSHCRMMEKWFFVFRAQLLRISRHSCLPSTTPCTSL